MNNIYVFVINKGGFKSFDKEGSLSYADINLDERLVNFITNRLKFYGYKNFSFIKYLNDIEEKSEDYICVINSVNPFFDAELIPKMLKMLERHPEYDACRPEGAVPGTEMDFIVRKSKLENIKNGTLKFVVYQHDTQSKYNNQFNLRKLKRIKYFLGLLDNVDDLHQLSISGLNEKLHDTKIFKKLIQYFEDVELKSIERCPCCGSDAQAIYLNASQPLVGYIPSDIPYHYRCVNCNLVFVSPYCVEADSEKLYDMFYSEAQGVNYFLNRQLHQEHYNTGMEIVKKNLPKNASILDLGCGSGSFLYYLKTNYSDFNVEGCDLSDRVKHFDFGDDVKIHETNFLKDDLGNSKYDLITAWEVIEHLPFSGFRIIINKIYNALKPGGIFMFSTPDFDSPLGKAFDFFASAPPHHNLVYSTTWMKHFFKNDAKWKIVGIKNESEMMNVFENWFGYWKSTSRNFETRAVAGMLLDMLKDTETGDAIKKFLKEKNMGVEMIGAIQKK